MAVKRVLESVGELLEGPVWCRRRNSLLFVDILFGMVYEYIPKMEKYRAWKLGKYVGCVLPGTDENEIIAAADHYLKRLRIREEKIEELCGVTMAEGLRFNDGKCGPGGELWVGIMAIDQSCKELVRQGGLYCVTSTGRAECVEENLGISNGMAWDWPGGWFYHIATEKQAVFMRQYDREHHRIYGEKKKIDLSQEQGVPDGMTIDQEGNLWIAMWGGYKVIQINPLTGKKLEEIELPDSKVSCCTFGGEDLDQLYITTAWDGETGGNVYETDMKVSGIVPYEFDWEGK